MVNITFQVQPQILQSSFGQSTTIQVPKKYISPLSFKVYLEQWYAASDVLYLAWKIEDITIFFVSWLHMNRLHLRELAVRAYFFFCGYYITLPLERTATSYTSFSNPLPSSLLGLVMLAPLSPTFSRTCLAKTNLKNCIQQLICSLQQKMTIRFFWSFFHSDSFCFRLLKQGKVILFLWTMIQK